MKEAKSQTKPKPSLGDSQEPRVVAVHCNPGPDAQDRLRRLFTLLLGHAAGSGRTSAPPEGDGADEECGDGNVS